MRITKLLTVVTLLFLFATSAIAQDIHHSQFYMSPLTLNPAMTGVMNCNNRFVANYRNQWASILKTNAFNTYSASYDQKVAVGRSDYFGFGVSLWGDKAGSLDFSTMHGKLTFAYSKKMGGYRSRAHYLVAGGEAGIAQRSINFLNAQWGDQQYEQGKYDPSLATGENIDLDNYIYADLGAGLLWFTVLDELKNFYVGAAFTHLNRANQSFKSEEYEALYTKLTVHGGGEFMLNPKFGFVPGFVMLSQGPSFELNAGTNVKFRLVKKRYNTQSFQIGAWMRIANDYQRSLMSDALILSTRFDYNDFSLGFSYDINVSPLRPATNGNGAFEFAFIYKICPRVKRGVYCPDF